MNVLESYLTNSSLLRDDPDSQTRRFKIMVYDPIPDAVLDHVQKLLLPGPTVCMFSGSWRLQLAATYLELRQFKNSKLAFHPRTLFVNLDETKLFHLTLSCLSPANLLILHNDWWTGHHPVDNLVTKLDNLCQYVQGQQGQVICSLPLVHLNFNKLKYSNNDIALRFDGTIVHDSMILVRK
jgi:hypothetical protein